MDDESIIRRWLEELESLYGARKKAEFQRERSTVEIYLRALRKTLGITYELEKPLAVGGTGVVFVGHHQRFTQPVAVKFNRPISTHEKSMVENESRILPTLSHPNIIGVLDLGEQNLEPEPMLTYIVEPFIKGAKPLFTIDPDKVKGTWLKQNIDSLSNQLPVDGDKARAEDYGKTAQLVNELLGKLTRVFAQWVSLLAHLHSPHASAQSGYVYLDVKPENVLVDDHEHLTSIDYGSVERLDPDDQLSLSIFYTEQYAHPKLIERKQEKTSSNRVRGGMKRSELRVVFDYYALGISLLEGLNAIALIRSHTVPQLPLYRSLHFLATRLLDGLNSHRQRDNRYQFAPQVFPSLRETDYPSLCYTGLSEASRDLEKELGRWNVESRVPELATYSKDIVRIVPGFNTVLTPRLRNVIEHPIIARLKYVTQLGLVSLVYPTADHSRYDHALGSYTYTTNYVKSLFNDLGNPIFRNLVGVEDFNAVLLASLLHDLGQYPLAHDLEEVHEKIFKHTGIGIEFLEDPMRDRHNRTLLEIIEDPKNGWGVSQTMLLQIYGGHSRNVGLKLKSGLDIEDTPGRSLKTDVLAAVIDGPVDADKADYIVRDSHRCELPYGNQLDLERLLRVLTVAIMPEDPPSSKRVTLGVYDKGIVSAHAFGQARYQLLATVYWHHTVRIAKAMLQYATAIGLPDVVFDAPKPAREQKELEIREQLVAFLKSLVPPFDILQQGVSTAAVRQKQFVDLQAKPPQQVLDILSESSRATGKAEAPMGWYPGVSWTDWLMLRWIANLPSASVSSKNLVHGLQTRRLYKRIAAFKRGSPPHETLIGRLDDLNWPARVDLSKKLSERVYARLRSDWGNLDTAAFMTKSEFDVLYESNLLVLVDIPNPDKKIGYVQPLGVVPELREKSYQQDVRQAFEDTPWRETMSRMIRAIAPVRVLCHPDVRNLASVSYAIARRTSEKETTVEQRIAKELLELL